MSRRALVLACSLAVVGALALAATQAVPAFPPDDAKVLVKLDEEWSKAAAARNLDLTLSFYTDDAVIYPPGEPIAVGKAAAAKIWSAYFAAPGFTISWKSTYAEVSGDLGYTGGPYQASFNDADGNPVHEKGKFLCIWKRQPGGGWKAIQDMWNTDSP